MRLRLFATYLSFRPTEHRLCDRVCDWGPTWRSIGRQHRLALVTLFCARVPLTINVLFRSFLLQVPLTVIAIIAVTLSLSLPQSPDPNIWVGFKRVDFSGALALVFSIFFLLYGLDRGGNVSWSDRLTVGSLVAFVVFFILLCAIEMFLAKEPFAPKRIILNRTLIASYLVNFFGMGSAMTILFHISLYFQAVQAKTAVQAGLGLLPSIGAGMIGSLGGGLIMQATGKFYWLTVAGYCSLFAGTTIIALSTGVLVHSFAGIAVGAQIRRYKYSCN
jgi:hypothetical protein